MSSIGNQRQGSDLQSRFLLVQDFVREFQTLMDTNKDLEETLARERQDSKDLKETLARVEAAMHHTREELVRTQAEHTAEKEELQRELHKITAAKDRISKQFLVTQDTVALVLGSYPLPVGENDKDEENQHSGNEEDVGEKLRLLEAIYTLAEDIRRNLIERE